MRRCCSAIALAVLLAGCHGFGRDLSPIRLEPIVTLGETSGEGAIATTPEVSAHHPGGFWIVTPAFSAIDALPMVYGDDGKYLGKLHGDTTLIGSMYGGAVFTRFGPGDSIWVFDVSGRVLIFGPHRNYARAFQLPSLPTDALILADNRFLATQDSGAIVTLFSPTGAVVREIGTMQAGPAHLGPRTVLIALGDGTFWTCTAHPKRQLEHWDTAGRRLRGIDPTDNHFSLQLGEPYSLGMRDKPPMTRMLPVWIDGKGRLWMLGAVADQHWQQGLDVSDTARPGFMAISDYDKYFDTTIEVRDLNSGALIASTRLDYRYSMVEPGVLVHLTSTAAGWRQAELMRVVFTEPASRP